MPIFFQHFEKWYYWSGLICKILKRKEMGLSIIIEKGYHSSLRNAFAHSQYHYDLAANNDKIYLDNYKGKGWELRSISFSDWTERFLYSYFLSYHLYNCLRLRRKNLPTELNSSIFKIDRPYRKAITMSQVPIVYNKEKDEFRYGYITHLST